MDWSKLLENKDVRSALIARFRLVGLGSFASALYFIGGRLAVE